MEKNDAYWDNLIAAYLDGTASAAEIQSLLRAVRTDPTIREMMDVLTRVDEAEAEAYPMYRMAAETKR